MVVIVILLVCVFSSLSQGLNNFSNCSATKCIQCSTNGNIGTSHQIDCDVKNVSEYHYEISCDDNCAVVDIPSDEHPPRVCFYQLNFFNGIWKLLATNLPTSEGDTCDTVQTLNDRRMVSPNCSSVIQRSSISDIYNGPYSCYCYNENCNKLNTITVEITNEDTPVISSSVDIGVYSSIINISPSLVYDTTHITSSVSSSTTGYINSCVTSSSSSFSSSNPLSSASNSFTYSSFVTQITTTVSTTPNNDNVSREAAYISVIGILSLLFALVFLIFFISCCCRYKKHSARRSQHSHHHHQSTPPPLYNIGVMEGDSFPIQLIHSIGHGKFGSVYKASFNGQLVAAKIFTSHHRHSWHNEKSLYTMESTAHENVLHYIDSEQRGTGYNMQLYMITEYHSLGSLNQFLLRNTVTWPKALNIIHSVSSGLAHLHSSIYVNSDGFAVEKYAIAHRDVKSANVLVKNDSGECVLGDLGLGLILDPAADDGHLANSGQVGTYRYMAPEALDARVNLRDIESFKQTDVYALALVMWEVCARCKIDDGPVQPYQLPFVDIVGERPTLELMKEVIVIEKNRPCLMGSWQFHEGLRLVSEMMFESWDEDPEARLTAANIVSRLDIMLQETQSKEKLTDEVENSSQAVVSPVLEASSSSIHKKVRISSSFSGQSNSHPVSPDVRLSVGNSEFPRSLLNVFQRQIRRVNFNHSENIELTNFQQLPTDHIPFQNHIPPHPHSSTQDAAVSYPHSITENHVTLYPHSATVSDQQLHQDLIPPNPHSYVQNGNGTIRTLNIDEATGQPQTDGNSNNTTNSDDVSTDSSNHSNL